MSCYQCCQKFGILNKQYSCSKCRFSFCYKCLKHKLKISDVSNELGSLCKRCYTPEVPGKSNDIEIPKNLQKLKEKNVTNKNQSDVINIEKRLNNLRSDNVTSCTTEDLEKRLQNLRGVPSTNVSDEKRNAPFYFPPKSEQDQIKQLLEQSQAEANIDRNLIESTKTRDKEIEQRLGNLKDVRTSNDIPQNNDYLNPDKVLEKILGEIELEKKLDSPSFNTRLEDQYEELPYCCMCTKDAAWRCFECGEDLYCDSCYRNCHKKSEYGPHKHEAYKQKGK